MPSGALGVSFAPGAPLVSASGVGNDAINVRIGLQSVEDFDAEAEEWLRRAYVENSCSSKQSEIGSSTKGPQQGMRWKPAPR